MYAQVAAHAVTRSVVVIQAGLPQRRARQQVELMPLRTLREKLLLQRDVSAAASKQRLNEGIVCLSDTRTNAGLDNISTYRKMFVFETPGERVTGVLRYNAEVHAPTGAPCLAPASLAATRIAA